MIKKFSIPGLPCILLLTGGLFSSVQAQQAVLTTSGNIKNGTGSVSYSVGQTAYFVQTGADGSIIEGVQQPYEIQFFPGVEEQKGRLTDCSLYPNPTTGEVTLKIGQQNLNGVTYRLTDLQGKLLSEEPVKTGQQPVPMESLSPGTYFLILVEQETICKTFKIIKR